MYTGSGGSTRHIYFPVCHSGSGHSSKKTGRPNFDRYLAGEPRRIIKVPIRDTCSYPWQLFLSTTPIPIHDTCSSFPSKKTVRSNLSRYLYLLACLFVAKHISLGLLFGRTSITLYIYIYFYSLTFLLVELHNYIVSSLYQNKKKQNKKRSEKNSAHTHARTHTHSHIHTESDRKHGYKVLLPFKQSTISRTHVNVHKGSHRCVKNTHEKNT